MAYRVDMSGARRVIPDGVYLLAVTKLEVKNAKSSGNPMVMLCTTVQEGEHTGFKVFPTNLVLTDKAAFKIEEFLQAINEPFDYSNGNSAELEPSEWYGKQFYAELKSFPLGNPPTGSDISQIVRFVPWGAAAGGEAKNVFDDDDTSTSRRRRRAE
jgi:hypothetical protein